MDQREMYHELVSQISKQSVSICNVFAGAVRRAEKSVTARCFVFGIKAAVCLCRSGRAAALSVGYTEKGRELKVGIGRVQPIRPPPRLRGDGLPAVHRQHVGSGNAST